MYTIEEIVETTGQTREDVERFLNELRRYRIIVQNEEINHKVLTTFQKAIENKKQNASWEISFNKVIQQEYGEEMVLPFYWTNEVILAELIDNIKKGKILVSPDKIGSCEDEMYNVLKAVINNFKELGRKFEVYHGSFGTDGNPITTFKCVGKDYLYYIVGKYNHVTKSEDIHVFYNDSLEFNIMKCKHICGGSSDTGKLQEIWEICREKSISARNSFDNENYS